MHVPFIEEERSSSLWKNHHFPLVTNVQIDWEETEKGYYSKMFIVNLLFRRKLMKPFWISMACIIKHASITILQGWYFPKERHLRHSEKVTSRRQDLYLTFLIELLTVYCLFSILHKSIEKIKQ